MLLCARETAPVEEYETKQNHVTFHHYNEQLVHVHYTMRDRQILPMPESRIALRALPTVSM